MTKRYGDATSSSNKPDIREDFFKVNISELEKLSPSKMKRSLENCRLLASKNENEEWAISILKFCRESGIKDL